MKLKNGILKKGSKYMNVRGILAFTGGWLPNILSITILLFGGYAGLRSSFH